MTGGALLKAEATGNDFLVGTGAWAERLAAGGGLVARLCRRRFGIGADGALALFREESAGVRLVYRNADGSEAAFCANGTRCAALVAVERLGMTGRLTVLTGRGAVPAAVASGRVVLELAPPEVPPRSVVLAAHGRSWEGTLLTVGVPHLVVSVEGLDSLDVAGMGPALRSHPALGPEGANVHFVEAAGPGRIALRSFERGVEGETLSCGSGAVAAALVAMAGSNTATVGVRTRGGALRVEALGSPLECGVRLAGPARIVAAVDPDPALLGPSG